MTFEDIGDRKGTSSIERGLREEIRGLYAIIKDLQNDNQRLKNELQGCIDSHG